jgi:hypothetical protein
MRSRCAGVISLNTILARYVGTSIFLTHSTFSNTSPAFEVVSFDDMSTGIEEADSTAKKRRHPQKFPSQTRIILIHRVLTNSVALTPLASIQNLSIARLGSAAVKNDTSVPSYLFTGGESHSSLV